MEETKEISFIVNGNGQEPKPYKEIEGITFKIEDKKEKLETIKVYSEMDYKNSIIVWLLSDNWNGQQSSAVDIINDHVGNSTTYIQTYLSNRKEIKETVSELVTKASVMNIRKVLTNEL